MTMPSREFLVGQATRNALHDNLSVVIQLEGTPAAMRRLMTICNPTHEQHWFFNETRAHYRALVSRFQSQEAV